MDYGANLGFYTCNTVSLCSDVLRHQNGPLTNIGIWCYIICHDINSEWIYPYVTTFFIISRPVFEVSFKDAVYSYSVRGSGHVYKNGEKQDDAPKVLAVEGEERNEDRRTDGTGERLGLCRVRTQFNSILKCYVSQFLEVAWLSLVFLRILQPE